ncbi:GntR family transcriptional regulator [Geminocystis sp. GBBB08]|uniref:GntR family transcriptional regulator n=1 Tax=Geminocystis sp. GBBB08 TaxID=2604140 RepID=UPI0027E2F3C5|nr:GntR family transcriptional regulator [Geminocystis sp. GBBB08]MBL1211657.1 GntR family transcriptional regulator [Geminocystis sp. GBBB08]
MFHFSIQTEGNISPSQQLIDQIQFAIASRQYPPGHRLPSTRQLALITGLHRNTISKVYRQLEEKGLVESLAGSGIYVKAQGNEAVKHSESRFLKAYPSVQKMIKQNVDELLLQGYNLEQIKQLFLGEIDYRLRCNALVLVTVPMTDIGVGQLIVLELEQALLIPIQLVPMEELNLILTEINSATIVTSRYFIHQVLEIVSPQSTRVIPLDIYDYKEELKIIKKLPSQSSLGIVSLSTGILRVAEILVHSLRGKDISIIIAQSNDSQKLKNLVRSSYTIICDSNSYLTVKKTLKQVQEDLIRPPEIICSNNYIGEKSINLLKRELGVKN